MPQQKLVIFVRAPRPGTVKTRLAKTLGAVPACEAYRRLVETLTDNLQTLNEVELRFSPDDAGNEIRPWLKSGWSCAPQGTGDLGQRLQSAFADSFKLGSARVVIIGSDCPVVARQDIVEAWHRLSSYDVALGPARDGGYWLIGLRRLQPELFHRIPWSTDRVLAETMRRAREGGLSVHRLRELRDVDTEADWREFSGTHNSHATNQ
jgi:rSAM/selenodomain-associated transferase 1